MDEVVEEGGGAEGGERGAAGEDLNWLRRASGLVGGEGCEGRGGHEERGLEL